MVKINKKIFNLLSLASLLTMIGVFFVLPSSSHASVSGIFKYTAIARNARIDGCAKACPARLVIPSSIKINSKVNLKVTSIGEDAFDNKKLTSVIISEGVTSIGSYAFQFNQISSIVLPRSLKIIGGAAFFTNKLSRANIPSGVTSIGGRAFSANQLQSIKIPPSVTEIIQDSFYNNRLVSADIPSSVKSIGANAFSHNKLRSIILPPLLTNIEDGVLSNNSLTKIAIPSGVTGIGSYPFSSNPNLSELTFLGNAPSLDAVSFNAFFGIATNAQVYRSKILTGFGANGDLWAGLTVAEPPVS